MTVREFINRVDATGDDVDVTDDYTGELYIAYVGTDVKLSPEGLKEFDNVLNLEVRWDGNCRNGAVVLIPDDDEEKMDSLLEDAIRFFCACAGYVSVSNYDKWFISAD